jgi:L-ascorbate metabolism protein UlaG (beta-lactamase superfamily)
MPDPLQHWRITKMKLTKYQHSCMVLEERGQKLVIDPGCYTETLGDVSDVVGVVVTHEHDDHMSLEKLRVVVTESPDAKIFTNADAAEKISRATRDSANVVVVDDGDRIDLGVFSMEFAGRFHATILPELPLARNVGVLVNRAFYYAGDAFAIPPLFNRSEGTSPPEHARLRVLAVPANGGWMKLSDAVSFLRRIEPANCFLCHDAQLSEIGLEGANTWTRWVCSRAGVEFTPLVPGSSVDIT